MITITMRPKAGFKDVAEVRFPYASETVAEFKRVAGGRAFWNRFQKFWECTDEPVIARIQAWAAERNGPAVAAVQAAEAVALTVARADRDAAEVIVAAAHARHPSRLARVGHSLMLCIVPQGLRLRGDVRAVLVRHGMPAHRTVMNGGVSLDRADREIDTSYATRLVAAVEEVLALLHGGDDAVSGVDLGAPDKIADVPVVVWDERPSSRPEEGSIGFDQHGNRYLFLDSKAELEATAGQVADFEDVMRREDTLTDPDVCREAVRRFKAARPYGVDATNRVLADYGLTFESELARWQRGHMRDGGRDMC